MPVIRRGQPSSPLARSPSAMSTGTASTVPDSPPLSALLPGTDAHDTFPYASGADGAQKRMRRRFSPEQLAMLEALYAANAHPSRVERDALATTYSLDLRTVTVWFQNKRQAERRVPGASTSSLGEYFEPSPPGTPTTHAYSPSLSKIGGRAVARTTSFPGPAPCLTLDAVAARPRGAFGAGPSTPRKLARARTAPELEGHAGLGLWERMPDSPARRADSPGAAAPLAHELTSPERTRGFVHRGPRRTLEWACAAERLARLDGAHPTAAARRAPRRASDAGSARSLDDDGPHEALTPAGSERGDDTGSTLWGAPPLLLPMPAPGQMVHPAPLKWVPVVLGPALRAPPPKAKEAAPMPSMAPGKARVNEARRVVPTSAAGTGAPPTRTFASEFAAPSMPPRVPNRLEDSSHRDDETMRAALALCGLGGGTR